MECFLSVHHQRFKVTAVWNSAPVGPFPNRPLSELPGCRQIFAVAATALPPEWPRLFICRARIPTPWSRKIPGREGCLKPNRTISNRKVRIMKHWISVIILLGTLAGGVSAAGKGPEITVIDNKYSVSADTISLGRLLRLFDQATGMRSRVPTELTDRNLSVRFSGLSFEDAVRKIFQGQPFNYVVIRGQGIMVTGSSQTLSASDSPVPAYAPPSQPVGTFLQDDPPFIPPVVQQMPSVAVQPTIGAISFPPAAVNPFNQQQQPQPLIIQTPFGPVTNPRADQPAQQNPTIIVTPNPSVYGTQPFGTNSSFGNSNPTGQNGLFGGSTPIIQNPSPQSVTPSAIFPSQNPQRRP